MGVDVHPGALGLFQEHLQVPQVMAGDQNAGAGSHPQGHFGDLRVAVGGGVGPVQQRHAGHAVLSCLQGQGYQLLLGEPVVQGGGQRPLEEGVQIRVLLPQGVGVLGVGGQSFQAVGDQLPQAADVLILGGQNPYPGGLVGKDSLRPGPVSCLGKAGGVLDLGKQDGLPVQGILHTGAEGGAVKVGVGDGKK